MKTTKRSKNDENIKNQTNTKKHHCNTYKSKIINMKSPTTPSVRRFEKGKKNWKHSISSCVGKNKLQKFGASPNSWPVATKVPAHEKRGVLKPGWQCDVILCFMLCLMFYLNVCCFFCHMFVNEFWGLKKCVSMNFDEFECLISRFARKSWDLEWFVPLVFELSIFGRCLCCCLLFTRL